MMFSTSWLPKSVYEVYKMGVGAWPSALEIAVGKEKMRDVNLLTDMIFFLHHPDRLNRTDYKSSSIQPDETDLIREWQKYRAIVKARISVQLWEKLPPVGGSPLVPSTPMPIDDPSSITPGHPMI